MRNKDLDHAIAMHVMGWRVHHRNTAFYVPASCENGLMPECGPRGSQDIDSWRPSCRIEDAWRVVEKISNPFSGLKHPPTGFPAATAFAHWFDSNSLWASPSDEAARDICMAALRCVGAAAPNPEVCGPAPLSPTGEKPIVAGYVSTAVVGREGQ